MLIVRLIAIKIFNRTAALLKITFYRLRELLYSFCPLLQVVSGFYLPNIPQNTKLRLA